MVGGLGHGPAAERFYDEEKRRQATAGRIGPVSAVRVCNRCGWTGTVKYCIDHQLKACPQCGNTGENCYTEHSQNYTMTPEQVRGGLNRPRGG